NLFLERPPLGLFVEQRVIEREGDVLRGHLELVEIGVGERLGRVLVEAFDRPECLAAAEQGIHQRRAECRNLALELGARIVGPEADGLLVEHRPARQAFPPGQPALDRRRRRVVGEVAGDQAPAAAARDPDARHLRTHQAPAVPGGVAEQIVEMRRRVERFGGLGAEGRNRLECDGRLGGSRTAERVRSVGIRHRGWTLARRAGALQGRARAKTAGRNPCRGRYLGHPFSLRTFGVAGMAKDHKRLGDMLIEAKVILPKDLDSAIAEQKKTGQLLGATMIKMGLVTEQQILVTLQQQLNLQLVDLTQTAADEQALSMVKEELAKKYGALPIEIEGRSTLVVAMADPLNVSAIEDLRFQSGMFIRPVLASPSAIFEAIERYYHIDTSMNEVIQNIISTEDDVIVNQVRDEEAQALGDLMKEAEGRPIVRLTNWLLHRAVEERASDIHVEPQDKELVIRLRIDGLLHEIQKLP